MKVKELIELIDCDVLNLADGEREIEGGYVGDLLSWVMGSAKSGNLWATIMTNLNVIAVAQLTDVSVVVVTETEEIDEDIVDRAKEQEINLISTKMTSWDICKLVADKI